MDFTKFVSMLDRNALFFTRVDQLDDKFEGSLSKYVIAPELEEKATPEERLKIQEYRKRFSPHYEHQRKTLAVNCWHMNEDESAAMWKLYSKSDEGIAIESTYRKLVDCFTASEKYYLWIGRVHYIDYNKQTIPINNTLFPVIYKRRSFEHENELRAVLSKHIKAEDYKDRSLIGCIDLLDFPENGVEIPVDINKLISVIHISPTAAKWFEDLVRSVARKYGLSKPVKKSCLADDPIF